MGITCFCFRRAETAASSTSEPLVNSRNRICGGPCSEFEYSRNQRLSTCKENHRHAQIACFVENPCSLFMCEFAPVGCMEQFRIAPLAVEVAAIGDAVDDKWWDVSASCEATCADTGCAMLSPRRQGRPLCESRCPVPDTDARTQQLGNGCLKRYRGMHSRRRFGPTDDPPPSRVIVEDRENSCDAAKPACSSSRAGPV